MKTAYTILALSFGTALVMAAPASAAPALNGAKVADQTLVQVIKKRCRKVCGPTRNGGWKCRCA